MAFDTVAWLTHKALGPRTGSQGGDGTEAGYGAESQPEDGRPANGVNGSESASGFRAPAHTNTPAAGENLAPNPRDGLPTADQLMALKAPSIMGSQTSDWKTGGVAPKLRAMEPNYSWGHTFLHT